jgi:hypothetical protein
LGQSDTTSAQNAANRWPPTSGADDEAASGTMVGADDALSDANENGESLGKMKQRHKTEKAVARSCSL